MEIIGTERELEQLMTIVSNGTDLADMAQQVTLHELDTILSEMASADTDLVRRWLALMEEARERLYTTAGVWRGVWADDDDEDDEEEE